MFKRWCFTLNNYSVVQNHEAFFSNLGDYGIQVQRYVVGYERGGAGTPHLQGYVELCRTQRLSYVRQIYDRAHWEAARGTAKQNYTYCTKSGYFFRSGDWEGTISRRQKGSDHVRDVIKTLYKDPADRAKYSAQYVRCKRSIDEVLCELRHQKELVNRYQALKDTKLKRWQMMTLLKIFNQGDRNILWVTDREGSSGKTYLAHVLFSCYQFELFDGVTAAKDIVFLLSQQIHGIVFDVTRNDSKSISYHTLEACKNGFLMTGKYQGKRRVFKPVPVVVFANISPDLEQLTADRWLQYEVSPQDKAQEAIYKPQTLWPFKEIQEEQFTEEGERTDQN
uniref:Replication-associated protein n=1 Tax=Cressdnaviricota sp. TaxID=2748378 RepID=A0A6M3YP81_9VIRU|nr:MAG: replication-associated protein [Cressdnaviricota sp.]